MDNPILTKLQTSPGDPPDIDTGAHQNRDSFLTESLKLIRKVIAGRRSVPSNDIPDIIQDAAFRLWKWRTKFQDKSSQMAEDDWNSFVARTAHNEANRKLANRDKLVSVPIDEIDVCDDLSTESSAEIVQLVETVWQGICILSLYQRQALLFNSIELVLHLLQFGIEEDELLAKLGLSRESWEAISARMPLTDSEIAEIANRNSGKLRIGTTAGAVKKARFDARKRLKVLIK